MNLISKIKALFERDAVHFVFGEIPTARVTFPDGTAAENQPIEAGKHYFRIVLSEMFLASASKVFTEWHPAVHSVVKLKFGDEEQTFTHVAGESFLGKIEQNLNQVVSLDHHLTPLIPFNGGTVECEAGLLALPGKDGIKSFLGFLGKVSEVLGGKALSSTLDMAKSLADGVAGIVDAVNGGMKIGIHDTWAAGGNALRSTHYAAVLKDAAQFSTGDLAVVKGRLHRGKAGGPTVALTGCDYMLFRIERLATRDDALSFSYIKEPFEQALTALYQGNVEGGRTLLASARTAARKAKDLTVDDRIAAGIRMQQQFDKEAGAPAGLARSMPSLRDLWSEPLDDTLLAEATRVGKRAFGLVD